MITRKQRQARRRHAIGWMQPKAFGVMPSQPKAPGAMPSQPKAPGAYPSRPKAPGAYLPSQLKPLPQAHPPPAALKGPAQREPRKPPSAPPSDLQGQQAKQNHLLRGTTNAGGRVKKRSMQDDLPIGAKRREDSATIAAMKKKLARVDWLLGPDSDEEGTGAQSKQHRQSQKAQSSQQAVSSQQAASWHTPSSSQASSPRQKAVQMEESSQQAAWARQAASSSSSSSS